MVVVGFMLVKVFSFCPPFCVICNLLYSTFILNLCCRCVQSSYCSDDLTATSWIAELDQVARIDGHSSAADIAWRLLKNFLEKHGSYPGCYKAVLATLLGYSHVVPAWFLSKYKVQF